MALVKSDSPLEQAVAEFRVRLTSDESTRFKSLLFSTRAPDASDITALTSRLDQEAQERSVRSFANRLFPFLEAVQQFSGIITTFVSANPSIAALVWGSVQVTLRLANNNFQYFDLLSQFLIDIGKLCPRFREYQALYRDTALQSALSNFYAEVVKCCTHVCEVLRRSGWLHLLRSVLTSFEAEFSPFRTRIQTSAHEVEETIKLTAAKDIKQQLRAQKRTLKDAIANSLRRETEHELERQRHAEATRKTRLLDGLSTYDQKTGYGQALRKRHRGTAKWLVATQEFREWYASGESAIFWLSGKLGSGKTILFASAVEQLCLQTSGAARIAYFFCRPEEEISLQGATILRSIIRQCLSAESLSQQVEIALAEMQEKPFARITDLMGLLRMTVPSNYVVIDGIDECPEPERRAVLSVLGDVVQSAAGCLKLMISSRGRATEHSYGLPKSKIYTTPVQSVALGADINAFIANELAGRQNSRDLVLGNPALVSYIQTALVTGAEGMFLWVDLQMEEICHQDSDQKIRAVIASLPKTLEETYQRMLRRVLKDVGARATEIFRWVMVAKRPLTLHELREALAVEKYSTHFNRERLINNIERIVSRFGGFLTLDEVSSGVSFAHPTMKRSLIQHYASLHRTPFGLADADKEAGEICITFLNFNDFRTQLTERNVAQSTTIDDVPVAVLQSTTLGRRIRMFQRPLQSPSSSQLVNRLLETQTAQHRRAARSQHEQHPFLAYASENWLAHSSRFEEGDRIWPLWRRVLSSEDMSGFIDRPWTAKQWYARDDVLCSTIIKYEHGALLQFIQSDNLTRSDARRSEVHFSDDQVRSMSQLAGVSGKIYLLNELFKLSQQKISKPSLLIFAMEEGYTESVRALINLETDVSAQESVSGEALQAASLGGSLEVVRLLLDAGADVNAEGGRYGTALQAASLGGSLEVVRLLLDAGADVNAEGDRYGTALHAASLGGSLEVVRLLLDAGADVNAEGGPDGTALQAASLGGSLEVVRLLLDAGADVNAEGGYYSTAIQAAMKSKNRKVVQLLLDAGAE